MATTASGVTIPGSSPTTTAATPIQDHWNNLGTSLTGRIIVPVASVTDRSALITALAAEGYTPSTSKPVFVLRADAGPGCEIEYTVNGTTWKVLFANSPVVTFASNDAGPVGAGGTVVLPAVTLPAVSHATRVFIQIEGQAGYAASASAVAIAIVGSNAVTTGTQRQVQVATAQWATVTRSGWMDIPANTTATVSAVSVQSIVNVYFSLNMTLTRVNV